MSEYREIAVGASVWRVRPGSIAETMAQYAARHAHTAEQAPGAHIRDAYDDICNSWPRKRLQWPVYTTCTCGGIITKESRAREWEHENN